MYIDEIFKINLKRFRNQNGLTQKELAEYSGISHKYIYKLESGMANPSIKMIDILAKTLGVKFIDFFKDENGEEIDFN